MVSDSWWSLILVWKSQGISYCLESGNPAANIAASGSDGGEEDLFLENCLVKPRQASHDWKLLCPHKECEEEVEKRTKDGTFATKADFLEKRAFFSGSRASRLFCYRLSFIRKCDCGGVRSGNI